MNLENSNLPVLIKVKNADGDGTNMVDAKKINFVQKSNSVGHDDDVFAISFGSGEMACNLYTKSTAEEIYKAYKTEIRNMSSM